VHVVLRWVSVGVVTCWALGSSVVSRWSMILELERPGVCGDEVRDPNSGILFGMFALLARFVSTLKRWSFERCKRISLAAEE
jgi:hypothetical protein